MDQYTGGAQMQTPNTVHFTYTLFFHQLAQRTSREMVSRAAHLLDLRSRTVSHDFSFLEHLLSAHECPSTILLFQDPSLIRNSTSYPTFKLNKTVKKWVTLWCYTPIKKSVTRAYWTEIFMNLFHCVNSGVKNWKHHHLLLFWFDCLWNLAWRRQILPFASLHSDC